MNTTPWFPPEVLPIHEGVYERKYHWGRGYAYWDGEDWGLSEETPEDAALWVNWSSAEVCEWRGLATQPGA